MGSADSKKEQNFPASLGGLEDENWRIPLGFPITAMDNVIQEVGDLFSPPQIIQINRDLLRRKRSVLIPNARRELEHLSKN